MDSNERKPPQLSSSSSPSASSLPIPHNTLNPAILDFVITSLCSMMPYAEIVRKVVANYSTSYPTAYKYCAVARKRLISGMQDSESQRAAHIAYRQAQLSTIEDPDVRLRYVDSIARLQGLNSNTLIVEHRRTKKVDDDTLVSRLASYSNG